MPQPSENMIPLHRDLDTAYVDVRALLRHLEGRGFTGLVHVELDEYEGRILLRAGAEVEAQTRDHASGEAAEGAAALESLLARAGEPGGLVSVYECSPEEVERMLAQAFGAEAAGDAQTPGDEGELLGLAGELVAGVERAVLIAGGDFEAALHAARLSLAEDFPFLDPFARRFAYAEGAVRLGAQAGERLFVSGVCEMLRRTVDHVAMSEQRLGVRKDAARELSILLRRRRSKLERFKLSTLQLERIAGMKLL